MPQPLNRVIPNGTFKPDPSVLDDKPEMASLVANIFAHWAHIEQCLSFLLVRILGADAEPAIAMFSTLTAQHLQIRALEAAAKAALSSEELDIFDAAMRVTESVQKERNRLAHWIWGGCPDLPDALLMAEPKAQKDRDYNIARTLLLSHQRGAPNLEELKKVTQFDASTILVYRTEDLKNIKRDMISGYVVIHHALMYLDRGLKLPSTPYGRQLLELLFQQLSEQRLFHEAWDHICEDRKNNRR